MKYSDFTGQTIGKWYVVCEAIKPYNCRDVPGYICRCECGTEKFMQPYELASGHRQECRACSIITKTPNLTGQQFGKWTAGERTFKFVINANRSIYNCRCECGYQDWILASNLIHGRTHGCKVCANLGRRIDEILLIVRRLKQEAFDRKLAFTISDNEAVQLIKSDCYYCGKPPQKVTNQRFYDRNVSRNGIDRVDSSKGYIHDNCVPCCKSCNYAKRDMPQQDFIDLCKRVAAKHG